MNPIDLHLNRTFGAAASKAFGLDPARVSRAEISPANQDTMNKAFAITFEVLLEADDLVRIGQLMDEPQDETEYLQRSEANTARLTEGMAQVGLGQREVQHVDTDEPEPVGIPPHVWLYRNMLTDLQRLAPLGIDETNGQYAVAIDQLTDEQRAIPHVSRQLPGDVLTVAVDAGVRIEENEIIKRC